MWLGLIDHKLICIVVRSAQYSLKCFTTSLSEHPVRHHDFGGSHNGMWDRAGTCTTILLILLFLDLARRDRDATNVSRIAAEVSIDVPNKSTYDTISIQTDSVSINSLISINLFWSLWSPHLHARMVDDRRQSLQPSDSLSLWLGVC